MNEAEEILNVEKASKFLNLSKSRIYQLEINGEIPFHKVGDKILFVKSELVDWIKRQ